MKVVGLMMVRDEQDILWLNVAHHLRLGIDEFRIVDNGSTDDTPRILKRLARLDRRVLHTRDDGPYRQSEITTELAREAFRAGAGWIVPIDADEMWVSDRRPLKQVLASSSAGALAASVMTVVQRRTQLRSAPRALLSMTHRALPAAPTYPEGKDLVRSDRIAFVEMPYPPKLIYRACSSLSIYLGSHGADGLSGPIEPTDEIVCMHAPLRSREALDAKAETGRRVAEAGFPGGHGWHAKRWRDLAVAGSLEAEWRANSHEAGCIDLHGGRRPLVVDTRFRDAVRGAMRLRWWPFNP